MRRAARPYSIASLRPSKASTSTSTASFCRSSTWSRTNEPNQGSCGVGYMRSEEHTSERLSDLRRNGAGAAQSVMRRREVEPPGPDGPPDAAGRPPVLNCVVAPVEGEHFHVDSELLQILDLVANERAKPGLLRGRVH